MQNVENVKIEKKLNLLEKTMTFLIILGALNFGLRYGLKPKRGLKTNFINEKSPLKIFFTSELMNSSSKTIYLFI